MKNGPTLIDDLYRATFKNVTMPGWRNNAAMRSALQSARRFVLDDRMSALLADLSVHPFLATEGSPRQLKVLEQVRMSARLPHRTTWVEYSLRATQARLYELKRVVDPRDTPDREGWLLQQHPALETAFIAHLFTGGRSTPDEWGTARWMFPVAYTWTVDHETVLPWRSNVENLRVAGVAVGVPAYASDRVGIVDGTDLVYNQYRPEDLIDSQRVRNELILEWTGILRRIWTFLATINELQVEYKAVEPSRGFIARGQYRRFLEHKTITLTVPRTADPVKIVRQAIAMARRRAHMVRGHWRKSTAQPEGRVWIREHQRGDASLGFVTHDYLVQAGEGAQKMLQSTK